MRIARAVGRNAAVIKYDLLTALGAHACAGDKHLQRLVLRFITLIVARYNWQADELAVGQREMAELWSVNERTVKRDAARLRELGWLVVKRPAVRGRVAVHGLGVGAILAATAGAWGRVGSDFAARMAGPDVAAAGPASNVISFPAPPPRAEGQGAWAQVQAALHAENPALYAAWFAALVPDPRPDGTLRLVAPSRFHASFVSIHHLGRLAALVRSVDPQVARVEVAAEPG